MRKIISTLLLSVLIVFYSAAQTGEISGKILDENNEGIPFANVTVVESGIPSGKGTVTDFDGNYSLKPLNPGKYDVKFSYVGYQAKLQTGVVVSADKTTFIDVKLSSQTTQIEEVKIIEYKVPLIDPGATSSQSTVTAEEIAALPTRNIQSIAATASGVYQQDQGGDLSIKGGRSNSTEFYIDGVKVRGSASLPASAIAQLQVVTGGVPARYGDATGGIVNITTKGAAKDFHGGIEVQTSQFLDAYGYNLVNANFSGPIIRNKEKQQTLLGYFLALEYLREKDRDPSAIGVWVAKEDVQADLEANPLTLTDDGENIILKAETLTFDDIENVKAKPNVVENNYRAVGRLDFRISDNINLAVGGNYIYRRYNDWIERYTLINNINNPLYNDQTYRAYMRFTQNIGQKVYEDDEDASQGRSAFQNAYYSLQVDYQKRLEKFSDEDLGEDIFNYGYVGNFKHEFTPIYTFNSSNSPLEIDGQNYIAWSNIGFTPSSVQFTPGLVNPIASRYTEQFIDLSETAPANIFEIQAGEGLVNGERAGNPHSVWFNVGRQFNGVGNSNDDEQYRIVVNGAFDILKPGASTRNKHNIEFGFEFEQRVDRTYTINPLGLWNAVLFYSNSHFSLTGLNERPDSAYINGTAWGWDDPNRPDVFETDTIIFSLDKQLDQQSNFDRSLREKMGLDPDGSDFLDWFNVDPSMLSLDMFSADDLYADGANLIGLNYFGYDYLGNRLTNQPSANEFFTAKDENGEFKREIPAFRPIYTAAFIQDKFHFKDLTFNVGLRIDRYDANQKVLRDPYSIYQIRSASEVATVGGTAITHPDNVGGDASVYVDQIENPNQVVGYRNGDQWYDAEGNELPDGTQVENASVSGVISPYLTDPTQDIKDGENYDPEGSFKDYEPDIVIMPRLQFSFNLTDKALFFAHYDILSQRPQSRNRFDPTDYLFFTDNIGAAVTNANLSAEKTIDFQLGFKQKVSQTSAITISAYYREFRDMVQLMNVRNAYPRDYLTWGNVDFGTSKGFAFDYDMRRTGNIRLKANYTIQFAEGTGSDDVTQQNIVQANQPNLRTISPLNFDARHTINVSMDYSYGSGKDYNGPVIKNNKKDKETQLLSNSGVNVTFLTRSGTPYTAQSNATPTAKTGVPSRPITQGTLNGSRLPWNFNVDTRIYKQFDLSIGGKKENKDPRTLSFNVYLMVQNLLNTQKIAGVYRYTGNPDDDGYLADPVGIQDKSTAFNPQSFEDLYTAYVNRPNNYQRPRRIFLGAVMSF